MFIKKLSVQCRKEVTTYNTLERINFIEVYMELGKAGG